MDLDQVFQTIIGYGTYQRKVVWSVGLINILAAFQNIHNVYLGAVPDFVCHQGTKQLDVCPSDSSICDKYTFPGTDFTSIVSEWGLVCSEAYRGQLVQSGYMLGHLVGNLVAGIVADRYGRKQTTCLCILFIGLFTACGAITHSYTTYMVIRGLAGVASGAGGLAGFVLVQELINQSERSFVGMVYPSIFAVGVGIFSVMAYTLRNWRVLTMATALPSLATLYYFRLLPESPRWLYSVKRKEEAEAVLEKIVLKNTGNSAPKEIILNDIPDREKHSEDNLSIWGILMHPILCSWTIISCITWFVCCAVYYGLTFGAGNLGSNMYISISLSGFVEIPANLLTWYLMEKLGRRYSYSWSLITGGFFCLGIVILPAGHPYIKTALALLGKMSIAVAFCVNWVYTAEMYPTPIRNKGLSISNMAARLGGIVSPMILAIGLSHAGMDFLIFGVLAFVSGVIALWLPETAKKPMPDTLEDLHKLIG